MHKLIKDITGQKFGRLTVIKINEGRHRGNIFWLCSCECGKFINVISSSLKSGNTKSCGCLIKENRVTHGYFLNLNKESRRFYTIWSMMRQRCNNKNHHAYKHYGDRGINVCKAWDDFKNFYYDMHESYLEHCSKFGEKNTSIDRIDNNGNYESSNCRWVTMKEQARNRRKNRFFTYKEETKTISEWAETNNISQRKLYQRLIIGKYSFEKSIDKNFKRHNIGASNTVLQPQKEIILKVPELLKKLPQRNQDILNIRFGLNGDKPMSLQEVGDKYLLSRERIRQIINKSIMILSKFSD